MKRTNTTKALIAGLLMMLAGQAFAQTAPKGSATWTSSTTQDVAVAILVSGSVEVDFNPSGTITAGTLNFEVSNDGGTTWYPIALARVDALTTDKTFSLNGATKQAWVGNVTGFSAFQVRLNPAITGSGSAAIAVYGSAGGNAGPRATIDNNTLIAGNPISTGQGIPDTGTQRVFVGQKVTYSFATTVKTATAAGTGPFFSICGSSTKTVRLQQLVIGGTVATAAVYGDVELTKTSAATSAGTATALTKVPHDSNAAASTVNLLNFYTALATAGTAVGKIGSQGAVFPITATVAAQQAQVFFDWTNRQESEAPVLRGTAQCIEASFGTTTTNAPTLTVQGIYTEE